MDTAHLQRSARTRVSDRVESLAYFLRQETTGGKLLLLATAVALLWANLAESSYHSFWATTAELGPSWLHLDLSLEAWAAEGLLAFFFFVAGLELKRELVVGELAERRAAALPLIAAVGGMVVPALVALAVSGGAAAEGGAWAIPVATDIAFALGVLALVGSMLPTGVRVLLLSIAVVDDLIAIALIAVVFTSDVSGAWLIAAAAGSAVYWLSFRARLDRAWLLWVLAVGVWVAVHASGVHATVAGIVLGLLTPVRPRRQETTPVGERLEHRIHPFSAGVAVPLFAVAAAGISVSGLTGAASDEVALGVFFGLLLGKVVGLYGAARLSVRLGLADLPDKVSWADVLPISVLGGIGYTVSLLMAQLAFDDAAAEEHAAAAILSASTIAALVAIVLLRRRREPSLD